MAYTWGNLKTELRATMFPTGEAPNLVLAHNKYFVDAYVDLQTWVECFQQDNTNIIPHCATYYKCGMTTFRAPNWSAIKSLSVIDKIDPETGLESATAADDWCSELFYNEVEWQRINEYVNCSVKAGGCLPVASFFLLPMSQCGSNGKLCCPVPTDEGLPSGLPSLSLGFHFAQANTDSSYGRALTGVWGKDRGNIYIAPWIQSTESVVLRWDGIKRQWNDADPIDDEPMLKRAIRAWVMREHAKDWDRDYNAAQVFDSEYKAALQDLIHACREGTRIRKTEASHARSASQTSTALFYNEEVAFTAHCPDGETGDPSTVTIPAGTVPSNRSVDHANQLALEQAKAQAEALLQCDEGEQIWWNDDVSETADCVSDSLHPDPDGESRTVIWPKNTVSSTQSKVAANNLAKQYALAKAREQLSCTYYNREITKSQLCSDDVTLKSYTVPASKHSAATQRAADALAETEAANGLANELLTCPVPPTIYWNSGASGVYETIFVITCLGSSGTAGTGGVSVPMVKNITVKVIVSFVVDPHIRSGTDEAALNQEAYNAGYNLAREWAQMKQATYNYVGPCVPHVEVLSGTVMITAGGVITS